MKKWQRTVETIAEGLDWSFSLNDNGKKICLQIYSPAGQDCNLEIDASSFNEYRQKVEEYYEDYDPEYEASLWYGAHRGEPSSLRELIDDMDWYDSKLKELSDKLDEYASKTNK